MPFKRSLHELAAESGVGEPAQCPAVHLAEGEHRVIEGDDQTVTDLAGRRELGSQVGQHLGAFRADPVHPRRRSRSTNRRRTDSVANTVSPVDTCRRCVLGYAGSVAVTGSVSVRCIQ